MVVFFTQFSCEKRSSIDQCSEEGVIGIDSFRFNIPHLSTYVTLRPQNISMLNIVMLIGYLCLYEILIFLIVLLIRVIKRDNDVIYGGILTFQ